MAKDNVEIIDGFYFGGTDDFLMPKKPNIDWGEEPQTPTASFVGGLGLDSSEKANSQDPLQIDTTPARKRRSGLSHTMLGIADLFNISSGDPDAYLGQSLDRAQHIDETRMKEDPEGYQIDMNRAKLLSQKAQAEEDPTRKAIYGREIKKLLPNETQGLDDLTAADFLVGDDKFRQKMQLEQLKGLNQLNLQKLKNGGNLDVAKLKATSNEDIAAMKTDAQREITLLKTEASKAISEGNNARAMAIQQMIDDRTRDIAELNNETKLRQTEMQQEGATGRTAMQQAGQNYRTEYANNSSFDRTKYSQDAATERTRMQQEGAMARVQAQQAGALERAMTSANARIEAAKLGGKNVAGVDSTTGDIIPSGGVVEALKIINEEPDLFSAVNGMFDNRAGRAFVLSDDTIRKRDRVKQELNSLVRASVQNLMQLFPKGGSGVVNTAKEQEFFVPVAAAIASGEANKIVPAVEAFYGQMYDAAASAGEEAPISRQEYINLMTKGATSDGRTKILRGNKPAGAAQQQSVGGGFNGVKTADGLIKLTLQGVGDGNNLYSGTIKYFD